MGFVAAISTLCEVYDLIEIPSTRRVANALVTSAQGDWKKRSLASKVIDNYYDEYLRVYHENKIAEERYRRLRISNSIFPGISAFGVTGLSYALLRDIQLASIPLILLIVVPLAVMMTAYLLFVHLHPWIVSHYEPEDFSHNPMYKLNALAEDSSEEDVLAYFETLFYQYRPVLTRQTRIRNEIMEKAVIARFIIVLPFLAAVLLMM